MKRPRVLIGLLLCFAAGAAACAGSSPASPAGARPQKPASSAAATDSASLAAALRAAGVRVEPAGAVEQPFFTVAGSLLRVEGEDVQVFRYPEAAAARAQAALVSPDGSAVGTAKMRWLGPPHFYQAGNLIVLYVGANTAVRKALDAVLGPPFAGRRD